ncbi:hypothetical protein [Aquabacterium sp.]|uniref:hypothetical protein n=1 Tax=Aquabacterium sp. TaxID=1872578 RepID=UPI0040381A8E
MADHATNLSRLWNTARLPIDWDGLPGNISAGNRRAVKAVMLVLLPEPPSNTQTGRKTLVVVANMVFS